MAIVRWQPRNMVRTLPSTDPVQTEFDRLFGWAFGNGDSVNGNRALVPAMDVTEEENQYVVRAELPGLTRDDIEITYKDGVLMLTGEKKEKTESKAGRYFLRERFEGKFGRNLQLPEKVDVEKIEATFENGILELVLPFNPEEQPKKIQIKK